MSKQTVLITGASAGIGCELSRVFAKNGYDLILVARREENLKALACELKTTYGVSAHVFVKDLMAREAPQQLFNEVTGADLRVDILVNNAGRGHFTEFLEMDSATDEDTLQLNIITLTTLSKLFGQAMVKQGYGKILNIASIAAFLPGPMMAIYNASKAYVLSFTEALNSELKGTGVTATVSCPGPTESEFMDLAGSDKLTNIKYARFMAADVVANEAYQATIDGRSVVVHGVSNKLITFVPRITPRAAVPAIIKRLMK